MFTGLIEEIGSVERVVKNGDGLILTVSAREIVKDMKKGDSISINGACQTVTELGHASFSVFVSTITASLTTLGKFGRGARVNLERAMTHQNRFGGHIVQGHVDTAGTVTGISKDASGLKIDISIETALLRYIVPRGSVAVDGVSLTVVDVAVDAFSVYLIPETMSRTVLVELKHGNRVNIEVDILAKYVEKMVQPLKEPVTKKKDRNLMKKLMEEGYNG